MADASPASDAPRQSWGVIAIFAVLVAVGAFVLNNDRTSGALMKWIQGTPLESRSLSQAELEAAGWSFPAWKLDEELVEEVLVVPRLSLTPSAGATFLEDGTGGGAVLLCHAAKWRAYDEHGQLTGKREVDGWGGELVRFEDADGQVYELEQRGEYMFSRATDVTCKRDGEVVWTRTCRSLDWKGSDPIHLEDGRALVLLHGYDDWLAVEPDGTVAWDRSEEFYASYGHSTHPDLPGIYLGWYGDLSWRRAKDGSQKGKDVDLPDVYVTGAAVLPGPTGQAFAFAVGSGMRERDGQGVILVVDDEDTPRWVAEAPTESLEVARLDVDDGPPLFVVATRTGDLVVIDAEGTVLHHRSLPQEPSEELGVAIYELDAGPLGPDHIGIAVTMLEWIAVYRIAR
jgi:hypothetical protein